MRLLLLTGGSRGIGRAIAEEFAARGFAVLEFSRGAPHSYSVQTDFSSPLDAQRTIGKALAGVDPNQVDELIAVGNAATLEPIGPVSRKTTPAIVANLNVNVVSAVLFVSAVVARFQDVRRRKVVANICAGAARNGVFGWSLYCAGKMALESFMRSLSIEQQAQPFPIVPVNIDPGVVDTEMHAVAAAAPPADFPASSRFAARRAEGRLTPPAQAAAAIAKILLSTELAPGASYDARDFDGRQEGSPAGRRGAH